ncbi:MAG: 4Fe-4S dicluster domain-containing protein [Chloroflexi bacterium]|nr:4Fe-4S dicluster domain-containing protein [Chloroflexota bacterium]
MTEAMGKEITRRQLLKLAGIGGTALAAASLVPRLVSAGSGMEQKKVSSRIRRWSMVIDMRRCDGCVGLGVPPQCTQACIMGRLVPAGMEWIQVFEYKMELGGTYFLPAPCQHCQNPPCLNVCPVGATFATPEGVVLIDQERCIGCRICMAACPYSRRFFNWGEPKVPKESLTMKYSPETQMPATRGTVMKCDFCPDLARMGLVPYCVTGCPRKAIYYGDLEEDLATNSQDVIQVSRFLALNQGYRLKEELNTQPRVFYIPGHGQDVGRTPYQSGLKPATWPWGGK